MLIKLRQPVYCCDFACTCRYPRLCLTFSQEHSLYDPTRCHAFHYYLSNDCQQLRTYLYRLVAMLVVVVTELSVARNIMKL